MGFQIIGNNFQFFFQFNDFEFTNICPFSINFKLTLSSDHLLLSFIILAISILCSILCFLKLFCKVCHFGLIFSSSVLENLSHTVTVIGLNGSFVVLLNSKDILLLSDLKIFFKFLNSSVKPVDLCLSCQHLSLLGLLGHDLVDKLLSELIIINLKSAGFQSQFSELFLCLLLRMLASLVCCSTTSHLSQRL